MQTFYVVLTIIGSLLGLAGLLLVGLHFYYRFLNQRLVSTLQRVPVSGEIGFQKFSTTVDSQEAKYFMEVNNGKPRNPAMEEKIEQVLALRQPHHDLSSFLGTVSQQLSHDFSAMYFAQEILADPDNRKAQKEMIERIDAVKDMEREKILDMFKPLQEFTFVFIPGFGYKFVKDLDASFKASRVIMADAGLDFHLIETNGVGKCEDNAVLIAEELRRLAKTKSKIVVVSASKGGPEAAEALGKLLTPEECQPIKIWLSIGGALKGSPMVDRLMRWHNYFYLKTMVFLMTGNKTKVAYETLGTRRRTKVHNSLKFPNDLHMVQLIPVPFSGQFSKYINANYRKIEKFGPNDGSTMLADQIIPNSQVLLYFGLDHCFADPDIDRISVAILQSVVENYITDQSMSPQSQSR